MKTFKQENKQNKNLKGEFDFIKRITGTNVKLRDDVVAGIGDDAAIVKGRADKCYLFTCDAQVEGQHFLEGRDPYLLGCRLAAVNLSDIAAMGGNPLWALSSLFIPERLYHNNFMEKVYEGLYYTLGRWDAIVVGGNISSLGDKFAMDLFLIGEIDESIVLKRSGAVAGQILCVSGFIGDSSLGLKIMSDLNIQQQIKNNGLDDSIKKLINSHIKPEPEIDIGKILASSRAVGACIDISDGLVQDAQHIADSSGVNIKIYQDDIPVSNEYKQVTNIFDENFKMLKLNGGEDYKLLFTIDKDRLKDVSNIIMDNTGSLIVAIGEVLEQNLNGKQKNRVDIYSNLGNKIYLNNDGFDHFGMGTS